MTNIPAGPTGPLTPPQAELLARLVRELSPTQLAWVSGYLAGLIEGRPSASAPAAAPELTVLFASQTGNAEKLARRLHGRLQERGLAARIEGMDSYKPARLKQDRYLLIVASTYGDGEPPDHAREFYDFLHSPRAPRLEGLRYAVLALGDTSYEWFCKTGRDFDQRLEALGATRLFPRADCDLDYEDRAEAWIEGVLGALPATAPSRVECTTTPGVPSAPPSYSRKRPFPAPILDNIPLTGRGSTKEVRHIELSLAGSGLQYQPGDALGVVPRNWRARVEELIACLDLAPDARVPDGEGGTITLEDALLNHYEITTLTRPFLEGYAELAGSRELAELLREDQRDRLRAFLQGREIIDLVQAYPVPGLSAERFVGLLRKLPPRLYSIASSLKAHPDEAHLTVAVVRYQSHGRQRQGVASVFLAEGVADGEPVPVYVHENPNFRLPEDPDAPVIMIGPGTGVAPFRAFLAEREATGAGGRNWLFFGDRHFRTDFLYQREWLEYRKKGLLHRIDVAFSRDDEAKTYVQHRMLEQSRELYAWLEQGAYCYVCGDAERMAPDVHQALIAVVAKEGGFDHQRAEAYVAELKAAKRYQRDVY
ncbi:assimilatory sulfite reductase (NADPH) flavoprotein subunit [Candidatus Methylocalor cossyra]|uniref:Sulfite reductase [NADPH] flavoprotein alpha-component n=1 Tax=Candidatus Methylocalor cossyra TaxID=3108543 RepID=A0ABM9NMC2_9GAMM